MGSVGHRPTWSTTWSASPAMARPCAQPGCPEVQAARYCAAHQQRITKAYNAQPKRRALYDAAWTAHSRQRRAEQPYCAMQDATCKGVLSVDHPTDAVLCISHHKRLEAQRVRDGR